MCDFIDLADNNNNYIKINKIRLMATARLDHHVLVLFKNNVWVVVEIKNHDGGQLGWGAARLRNIVRIH